MCARRFLMLIFILTLIVVGGAFLFYQWGGNVLIRMATPTGHYQQPPNGSGPDYSKAESWIARPDIKENPSKWLPEGVELYPNNMERAATFYVHPTTYLERDRWNAPIEPGGETEQRTRLFVQSEASAFNSVSDVWAPKYRQAAYGAFLLKSEDARKALDLAYRDILAAFDVFLAAQPKDMPIILAGHSQGSMHLLRLLVDRKDALKGRLIAAYVIGWPVGITSDLPATGFPACTAADQRSCVVSWQSFKEPANTSLVTEAWVGTAGLTGKPRTRADMLCTNPLTGATYEGAVSKIANKGGTLVPDGGLTRATLEPGRVGAECYRGFLMIDGDIPNFGPYVLPGNNYHVYDYALFWGHVRMGAECRVGPCAR
ncbi:DUF3089 domain-containing protein [Sphingomonas sp.]|uniref:DUF3089 domain-containing protein n=1 Tax=Sphingomonas sp. TaxID=28214 RepID=UPI0025F7BAA9|nr:DUF3089 domain-containing protein [Sphingomonas sp.]